MAEPSSLTCPRCGETTYDPTEISTLSCGLCKAPTSDPNWTPPPGWRPSGVGIYSQGPGQFPGGRIQWG